MPEPAAPDGPLDAAPTGICPHAEDSGEPSCSHARSAWATPAGPRLGGWPTLAILAVAAAALTLGLMREGAPARPGPTESTLPFRAEAEAVRLEVAARRLWPFELALVGAGLAALGALLSARARAWLLPPPRLAPRGNWPAVVVVQCVALALLLVLLAAEAGARFFPDGPRGTFLAHASAQLGLGVALLPAILSPGRDGASDGLARLGAVSAHAGSNALRGAVAYLVALPLSLAAAEYARIAEGLAGRESPAHPVIRELVSSGAAETALLVVATCVIAPVFEELFFRGFVYAAIRDRWGLGAGLVASSLLFASVHPGLPNQAATAALGLVLAAVYERAGTLAAPVTAHALFNGVQLAFVLAARAG